MKTPDGWKIFVSAAAIAALTITAVTPSPVLAQAPASSIDVAGIKRQISENLNEMAKMATIGGPCGTANSISIAESLCAYFRQNCDVEPMPGIVPIRNADFLVGGISSAINGALITHVSIKKSQTRVNKSGLQARAILYLEVKMEYQNNTDFYNGWYQCDWENQNGSWLITRVRPLTFDATQGGSEMPWASFDPFWDDYFY